VGGSRSGQNAPSSLIPVFHPNDTVTFKMSSDRRTFLKSSAGIAGAALVVPHGMADILLSESEPPVHPDNIYDFIVYGSTPSGIMAAIAASRKGLKVAMLDRFPHVGGMMTGGLSYTDRGNTSTIGGLPREFFERVSRYYRLEEVWGFEPHVAEQIYTQMLKEANIAIRMDTRLRETHGVVRRGTRITQIVMENGERFSARIFADCTYDGDLMNFAGVKNTWGRESAAQYGESLAGVLPTLRLDLQFRAKVSPYGSNGKLLPGISSLPKGKLGEGDKKIPAYNYRFCFSKDKNNQVPYPRPDGYDAHQYELLARYLPELQKTVGRGLRISDIFLAEPLQNDKADFNNMGAFSTDYIGTNWEYPTASYARRNEIIRELHKYDAGLLYFVANDPRVPTSLQREMNSWGMAKDEFPDTDHWPWRIYIREARRMIGEYVFTQHDAQQNSTKQDSIGVGSYQLDSHNVQRVATPDGGVENEGDMYVVVDPYEIPYRSIVPKRAEATNLLVPVCMSATHAAYGTIRQEPVYMILGQGTGTAAAIAVHGNLDVQDVPITKLQERLMADEAILHWKKA
jgi:hypothetical protein